MNFPPCPHCFFRADVGWFDAAGHQLKQRVTTPHCEERTAHSRKDTNKTRRDDTDQSEARSYADPFSRPEDDVPQVLSRS